MSKSKQISKAKSLLIETKGKSLSMEERRDKSIELAAWLITESRDRLTSMERSIQAQLAGMMQDETGKAFTTSMTDQCFRTQSYSRVADQIVYLLKKYGVPSFLPFEKRLKMGLFRFLGRWLPALFVPAANYLVRREALRVIVSAEEEKLAKHMKKRHQEGVRVNLNHLGEAILGENEAEMRLQQYLESLSREDVDYVSVKISSIYSQINLLAWESTVQALADRLRQLYRAAVEHPYRRADGTMEPKFVNLDMEEYRDLNLTVEVFKRVLDEPEFRDLSAGIVLQSYLPDSYLVQQDLTVWAMKRVANGGAPIKIRIVKGANLMMERVESSIGGWAQAPYTSKLEVDANYKRMVLYACQPEHCRAAHVGIGSHNLFDIAFAMLLREENEVQSFVSFEMLEGMADHMRRVVQELVGDMLLYSPAAGRQSFHTAVTYLIRRLDENTGPENFLRHSFSLEPNTAIWDEQVERFSKACDLIPAVATASRRCLNRYESGSELSEQKKFENDAHTDWALPVNVRWAREVVEQWRTRSFEAISSVVGGRSVGESGRKAEGRSPSDPNRVLYEYFLASSGDIECALVHAVEAKSQWASVPVQERIGLAKEVARLLRERRGDLIGAMIMDGGKVFTEADGEVSDAIDFAEYYWRSLRDWMAEPGLHFEGKGVALVTPPWNFPCAIPLGGVIAALLTGNAVIFKPARETVLVAWELVQLLWEAGIPKNVLQFVICEDDPEGSQLIADERVDLVVLTGASDTARLFLKLHPGLDLMAETGGKNALIATAMADRDLVVRDLIYSAFGHGGQKCSAASLGILEAELYDSERFRDQLKDAAESLKVGPAWQLRTRVNPLIHEPNPVLKRGLTELDEGEEWLLEPKQDPKNPQLWSPGIKLGVQEGSYSHQTEFFGPVLSLMRARHLDEAIRLANGTPYGLTSGLHSLDEREQSRWLERIQAGNLYVNRQITGAIVGRQPFGGMKASAFGRGAKAGGPNYLLSMMRVQAEAQPRDEKECQPSLQRFASYCRDESVKQSLADYSYWWKHYFSQARDEALLIGQDNLLEYRPRQDVPIRIQEGDTVEDVLRLIGAALTVGTRVELSLAESAASALKEQMGFRGLPGIKLIEESEEEWLKRLTETPVQWVRVLSDLSPHANEQLAALSCQILKDPVVPNGRIELLHFLHEVAISKDYHRYGNLGDRESEARASLLGTPCTEGVGDRGESTEV